MIRPFIIRACYDTPILRDAHFPDDVQVLHDAPAHFHDLALRDAPDVGGAPYAHGVQGADPFLVVFDLLFS